METTREKEVSELNKLVEYNNDRVEGYQKAADETEHADLKFLFKKNSEQSVKFSQELSNRVRSLGGEPIEGTTNSGKLYRAWMDVKAALTGKDRKAILGSCEFGEDVALEAYQDVLNGDDINVETRTLLEAQARQIRAAHDEIKSMRDMAIS